MRLPCFTCFCKALWALWMFWQTCPALAMPSSQYFDYLFLWLYQFNFQFLVDGFKKERLLEVDITVLEAGLLSPNWGPPKAFHREETHVPSSCMLGGCSLSRAGSQDQQKHILKVVLRPWGHLYAWCFCVINISLWVVDLTNLRFSLSYDLALDLKCLFMTEITTSRCVVQARYFTNIILILPKILLRSKFLGGKTKAERS